MTALALNVRDAATAVGLSEDVIKRAIRSGALRAKRSGGTQKEPAGKYVILVADLNKWLEGLVDA